MTDWKPTEINHSQTIPIDPEWYKTKFPDYQLIIKQPNLSNWTCYLFGGSPGNGIQWTPKEGTVPNAWVRFWMKVFFDCKWVENK